jgi:8-oxo-dGTP diphosphatase
MVQSNYINSLPKKPIGAAAIIFNSKKELLIVKPSYREGWLVPGGTVDALESPDMACIREIKEEVGLDIQSVKFLGVYHMTGKTAEGMAYDSMQFMFYVGILTDEQVKSIVLQEKELVEYRFLPMNEAVELLADKLDKRINRALEALEKGGCVYGESIHV